MRFQNHPIRLFFESTAWPPETVSTVHPRFAYFATSALRICERVSSGSAAGVAFTSVIPEP